MLLVDRKPAPEVTVAGLGLVAKSHTLRCDVKQAEERYYKFDEWIERRPYFWINDVLPGQIYKGTQPKYLDQRDEDAVPVISTICIQNLEIVDSACR